MAEIRVGKVSSVNYSSGMARVVYTDKNNSVTKELPLLSFEYHMPPVGSQVLVLHLSNGAEMGMVLGRTWSSKTVPFEGMKGLYRKELSNTDDEAVIRYFEDDREFSLKVPKIIIKAYEEAAELIAMKKMILQSMQDEIDLMAEKAVNIKTQNMNITLENGELQVKVKKFSIVHDQDESKMKITYDDETGELKIKAKVITEEQG